MPALEVRKLKRAGGKLCESCLHEPGPSRAARFQVFVIGMPADRVCVACAKTWTETFERRGLAA